jgi:hypothetical protein
VQPPHPFLIASQHGRRQRGLPAAVFCLQIRTELDQQIEDVVAFSADSKMEPRHAVFEAREAAVAKLWICSTSVRIRSRSPTRIAENMW